MAATASRSGWWSCSTILCDELQCWDRTAYGRNTKTALNPMGAEFDFSDNRIIATYLFDQDEQEKIDAYHQDYVAWKKAGKPGKAPKLKAYSDIAGEKNHFADEIEYLVNTEGVPLIVACYTAPTDRSGKHVYLSDSNFLHIRDFAITLNARYQGLSEQDKGKDWLPFNSMLKLIGRFDGLRIYQLPHDAKSVR